MFRGGRVQPVGHIAKRCAQLLAGKHKPSYLRTEDRGDFVVVVNADKVKFKGPTAQTKVYRHHTGFPGGLKTIGVREMFIKHPTFPLFNAIKGMLPRNGTRYERLARLKLYKGERLTDYNNGKREFPELVLRASQLRHMPIFPSYQQPPLQEVFEGPAEPVPSKFEPLPVNKAERTLPAKVVPKKQPQ
jgi:large subunit ribosomal protein L13